MSHNQNAYKATREGEADLRALLQPESTIKGYTEGNSEQKLALVLAGPNRRGLSHKHRDFANRVLERVAPRLHAAFAEAVLDEARALLAQDREAAIAEAMDFVRWVAENQEVRP